MTDEQAKQAREQIVAECEKHIRLYHSAQADFDDAVKSYDLIHAITHHTEKLVQRRPVYWRAQAILRQINEAENDAEALAAIRAYIEKCRELLQCFGLCRSTHPLANFVEDTARVAEVTMLFDVYSGLLYRIDAIITEALAQGDE